MFTTIAMAVSFVGLALAFVCLILVATQIVKDNSTLVPAIGFVLGAVLLTGGALAYPGNEPVGTPGLLSNKPTVTAPKEDKAPAGNDEGEGDSGIAEPNDSDMFSQAGGTYKIGETWAVDGQWLVTVTGVTETSERNQYSEKDPGAVYIVDYTYTNVGYVKEDRDGLFLDLEGAIVDSAGIIGDTYPNSYTYPSETPVAATCNAQLCICVENPGDFKIVYSKLDGNNQRQTATFEIAVPQ